MCVCTCRSQSLQQIKTASQRCKTKKKRKRTGNAPKESSGGMKKPKTAYTFYQLAVMQQHWIEVEADQDTSQSSRETLSRKVARLTGQRWKALSDSQKEPYSTLALEARHKYKKNVSAVVSVDDTAAPKVELMPPGVGVAPQIAQNTTAPPIPVPSYSPSPIPVPVKSPAFVAAGNLSAVTIARPASDVTTIPSVAESA